MHSLIYAVVIADNEEQAIDLAESIFKRITGVDYQPFEYYSLFGSSRLWAEKRWGELPRVCLADSDEGKEMLAEAMKSQRIRFMHALKRMRRCLTTNKNESLWLDDTHAYLNNVRYLAHELSCRNSNVILYQEHGERINTPSELEDVLSKWSCLPEYHEKYKDMNVYVVPADAHY